MKNDQIYFHSTKEIEPLLEEIRDLIFNRIKANSDITVLLLLICGLLNKTYELTETALWAIKNDRPQTSAFMLRGLFETLAITYYINDKLQNTKPEDFSEVINSIAFGSRKPDSKYQSINILTCIDRASKRFSNLRKGYDALSEIVHPNSVSHFYLAQATDEENRLASIEIPFYKFKKNDKEASLNQVGECCSHIITLSRSLILLS